MRRRAEKVYRVSILFTLAFLLGISGFSQNFTGLWSGYLYTSGNQVPYELLIGQSNDRLKGYSLIVFTINGVENTGIKSLKLKTKRSEVSIEDDALIFNDYTTPGKKLTLYSTLALALKDSVWTLEGSFFTRSVDRSAFKGTIRLQRVRQSPGSKLVDQLAAMDLFAQLSFINPGAETKSMQAPPGPNETEALAGSLEPGTAKELTLKAVDRSALSQLPANRKNMAAGPAFMGSISPGLSFPKPAAELNRRKTEIIRSIPFQSDSLVLTLYDNGEVDGDTVSVVLNGKVIIAGLGLTSNPVTATFYFDEKAGDSVYLVMYAENLGRIAPNTGVLMIQDGYERHQVRFEGDFQKNSGVVLRRKVNPD